MKYLFQPVLILLIGSLLTLILTWPFITKLSTYYDDSGDYAFDGSMLYYNQLAIKTGNILNQTKYFDGYQYYPQPLTISYADHLLIPSLIFSPIFWITGDFIFSVNSLALITFILSFIISFYTINFFTKNFFASIIGATVYTFNPQIFARFPYHIGLLSHFFLPLIFLSAYKFFTNPSFKNSFFFGASFALNALTAVYFQILSIIFLPFFIFPFLTFNFVKGNWSYFLKLLKLLAPLFIFLPILWHFNSPYLEFSKNESATRRLEETFFFSGRIINWFFANPDSLVYGNFVKNFERVRSPGIDQMVGKFNYAEHTLFLNILPLALFLIGILYLKKKYTRKALKSEKILLGISLLLILFSALILSLGPLFFGWNGEGPYFKLPFYYLYHFVDILKGLRVPNRLQFIFYIPFVIILSFGAFYILTCVKIKILRYIIFFVLVVILVLENLHLRTYDNKSSILNTNHQELLKLTLKSLENKHILHIPIHIPELGESNTYTLNWYILTKAKSLNGYSGYAPPDQLVFLGSIKDKLDDEVIKKLKILNTDYIVIHKDLIDPKNETYKKFYNLYQIGTIYEDEKLQIVDLKKYTFNYRLCDFDKDITKNLKITSMQNNPLQFYALFLKNDSDCYLPSIYWEKYRKWKFFTNFIGQPTEHTASLRMPVILSPGQEVVLSEVTNNLRIDN